MHFFFLCLSTKPTCKFNHVAFLYGKNKIEERLKMREKTNKSSLYKG